MNPPSNIKKKKKINDASLFKKIKKEPDEKLQKVCLTTPKHLYPDENQSFMPIKARLTRKKFKSTMQSV